MRGRFWTILLDIRLTLGPFSGGLFCPFHALLSQLLLDGVRCSCLCSPFLGESRVWVKLGILDSKRLVLKKLVFNSWSLVKNLLIRKSGINFSPDRPSSPSGQGTCPAARQATAHSPPSARRWWAGGWVGLHCIAENKKLFRVDLDFWNTYWNPLIPDDFINCVSLFRICFQATLDKVLSIRGHVGPLWFRKLILPWSYPLLHARRDWQTMVWVERRKSAQSEMKKHLFNLRRTIYSIHI